MDRESGRDRITAISALVGIVCSVFFYFAAQIVNLMLFDYRTVLHLGIGLSILGIAMIVLSINRYATAISVGVVLAVLLFWLTPGPRDVFLEDLYSIEPGMTVTQVKAKMKTYILNYEGKGCMSDPTRTDRIWLSRQAKRLNRIPSLRNHRPSQDETYLCYRHSNTEAYGGDVATIYFWQGKVIRVGFHPD